jgi:demethylmenaquinone methyltransferase/2-methoxy-6-polyprenyl-1,4-benzoquinol methylase
MHAARRHDERRDICSVSRSDAGRPAPPGERETLDAALATPDRKARYVRRLFHTIADRYDLITVLLSFGRDRAWKRRLVSMAPLSRTTRALDVACGTGDITFELASRGAHVIGLDLTPRMIELATRKIGVGRLFRDAARSNLPTPIFLVGDMSILPFADASFDLVTTGYGLRNVPVLERAIDEVARVLTPGGVLLSLDFNRPDAAWLRRVYLAYLNAIGGALGWMLHGDADTYRYIPATIGRYPGAARVAAVMRQRGFAVAEWQPVLGGLMSIHYARRA